MLKSNHITMHNRVTLMLPQCILAHMKTHCRVWLVLCVTRVCNRNVICPLWSGLVAGRSPVGWLPIPDDFSPLLRFLPGERSGTEPGARHPRHVGSAVAAQEQLRSQHRHSGRHHRATPVHDELSGNSIRGEREKPRNLQNISSIV